MVFFSVGALWGSSSTLKTHNRRAAWWGIASATLACMVKIRAVLTFRCRLRGSRGTMSWKDQRPLPGAAGSARTFAPCSTHSGSPPWAFHSSARRCGTGTGTGSSTALDSVRRFSIRQVAYSPDVAIAMGTGDGRVALEHAQSTRRPGVLLDDSGSNVLHAPDARRVRAGSFRARRLLGAPGLASGGCLAGRRVALHPRVGRRQSVPRVPSAADAAAGGVTLRPRGLSGLRRRVAAPHHGLAARANRFCARRHRDRSDGLLVQQCRP